ncbi:hypothetical protein NC99_33440 [Sunxiuqinia dokdonensis]|uniref:Uncharacterized protein n=1 Tax=Sunxiuqinia dokdonensis TaxID=1409788 RepID=A0A0L8V667_9BACT|nr:hypothetical protein NC99_33440 [Sunxiuqinia dokdonensis]
MSSKVADSNFGKHDKKQENRLSYRLIYKKIRQILSLFKMFDKIVFISVFEYQITSKNIVFI